MGQFLRGPFRHPPLFVTGIDESQVFLPIVVESKWAIIGNIMFHFLIPLAARPVCLVAGCNDATICLRRMQPDVIAKPLRCLNSYISTGAESQT